MLSYRIVSTSSSTGGTLFTAGMGMGLLLALTYPTDIG